MARTVWAIWIMLVVALATTVSHAQTSDAKRDQVAAATARAVERLRTQIAAEQIGHSVTVGDLLKATDGNDFLTKTLERSQMIGGPRWLDDQTCQVRLEISGPRVAAALVQIANLNPRKSPIAPDVLAGRLRQWDNKTFCATSTSTGATVVEHVRPIEEGPEWSNISDAQRKKTISAAKRNAIASAILAINPIPLNNGKTVADALNDPSVRGAVDNWLASRPVTQVEFRPDMQVGVTIATPPNELAEAFLSTQKDLDQATRDGVRSAFAARVSPSTRGQARVGEAPTTEPRIVLPTVAPSWADEQIEADGSGSSHGSSLKAGRAAEADAQAQLRSKINALPLSDGLTLGQAAHKDARIDDAIARTVSRARASKVDYQGDGSAKVRVSLELHDLWEAIWAANQ